MWKRGLFDNRAIHLDGREVYAAEGGGYIYWMGTGDHFMRTTGFMGMGPQQPVLWPGAGTLADYLNTPVT